MIERKKGSEDERFANCVSLFGGNDASSLGEAKGGEAKVFCV